MFLLQYHLQITSHSYFYENVEDANRELTETYERVGGIFPWSIQEYNMGDLVTVKSPMDGGQIITGKIVGWENTSDGARAVWVNTKHGNQLYYPYQIQNPS